MNVSDKNVLLNINFIHTAICKISFHRFYRYCYAEVKCFNETGDTVKSYCDLLLLSAYDFLWD